MAKSTFWTITATLTVCYVCAAASARAQQQDKTSTSTETSNAVHTGELQEVVVTAEKTSSTVQLTPASVTVLNAAQLDASGVTDLGGLPCRTVPPLSPAFRAA
jgi:outer membrane cobalamin receptor